MLLAYKLPKKYYIHLPLVISVIIIDLCMPFYLYSTGDWAKRLIDDEEIFSFLIWTHFGLIICLYILFIMQAYTAKLMIAGEAKARGLHHKQAKALLLIKFLVVLSGAILVK